MDSEKRFQQIAENVGEWIWEVDVTGLYTYASPSVERMLGYTPEEIVRKKRFYDLFSPENREQLKKTFFKVFIKQESFQEFIHQDIHKNGDIVWLSSSGQPIVDRQGNLHGYRGTHRNITEIKRSEEALRQSEAQKRAILDASIDQIRLVDTDRRIIWVNKTATRELNIAPEDIAGQFCYDVFVGRDTPCLECPTEKALSSGTIEHAILHTPHLKGIKEETYWDSYAVPIKDESGDIVTIIQITRDITKKVNAENALKEREKELKEKTKRLEELNTALKVLLKRRGKDKEEFEERVLANVKELIIPYINELKITPLHTAQKTYVEIIESNLNEIISPFLHTLSSAYLRLTPKEIQIANLVKEAKTTKEIAWLLHSSPRTIETHRKNIRKKMGLKKKKNLRTRLLTLR